jgi:hypothetical protein
MNTGNQELFESIRKILNNEWDPAGIAGNVNLLDEYDGFIPDIINLLSKSDLAFDDVYRHIRHLECSIFGYQESSIETELAARSIYKLSE